MPVLVPFIVGAVSLGVATVAAFEGPIQTLAVLFEALWIFLIGRRMITRDRFLPLLLIPFLAPVILSINSIESVAWDQGLFHMDSLVLLSMSGVSGLVAWYLSKAHHALFSFRSDAIDDLEHTSWIVAGLYGVVWVWLASQALLPDVGALLPVTIYTFIAMCAYMASRTLSARWRRQAAGIVAGLVVAMALVLDPAHISTATTMLIYVFVCGILVTLAWLERDAFTKHSWWTR